MVRFKNRGCFAAILWPKGHSADFYGIFMRVDAATLRPTYCGWSVRAAVDPDGNLHAEHAAAILVTAVDLRPAERRRGWLVVLAEIVLRQRHVGIGRPVLLGQQLTHKLGARRLGRLHRSRRHRLLLVGSPGSLAEDGEGGGRQQGDQAPRNQRGHTYQGHTRGVLSLGRSSPRQLFI